MTSDIIVYICCNCVPDGRRLPRQWNYDTAKVQVREIPCSGKIDGQFLMHALEGNARGLCVVACPKGECHLAEGNYRAEVRVRTTQRLLSEIGLESERIELIHYSNDNNSLGSLKQAIDESVKRFMAYSQSPLSAAS